ncbi:MAG: substrate-binding domain-containing protein [Planctomycetaceae bacterium]|nr:substrate-binding domain-containing protein [Planctomycetaceae bacterium]
MQRISRFSIWVCSLGLMFLIGCDSQQSNTPSTNSGATSESSTSDAAPAKESYRIVLITNGSSPFWDAADRGSQEAGDKLGVKVEFLRNDATEAGQIERLEQLAGQKDVKGIGISLIDEKATGVIDQMKALREKGIHVITFDADGPKDCREAFVGTNNLEAGRALGQATATLRPDGGSTVCFVGIKGSQNARERLQGFTEGAGEKIKVVDEKSGEDLTRAVLLQIVSEQEHFGSPVLSIDLLEAIIRFYGNPAQELLTRYLEQSLGGLMQQQRVMQAEMAKALQSPMAPLAELTRQNMELWSKMQSSMLSSFSPPAPESKPKSGPDSTSPPKGKR